MRQKNNKRELRTRIFRIVILILLFISGLLFTAKFESIKNSINTRNWITYNFDKCGNFPRKFPFSLKVPNEFKQSMEDNYQCCTDYMFKNQDLQFTVTCGDGFGGGGCGIVNDQIQEKFWTNNKTIYGCLEKVKESGTLILRTTYLSPTKDVNNKPGLSITAKGNDTVKNRQLINLILSTIRIKE